MTALTPRQHAAAWRTQFRFRLDDLPDQELRWERARWNWLAAPVLAGLCARLLDERAEGDLVIPDGAAAHDLDALWNALDATAVLAIARREALPLVTAMRTTYWQGRQKAGAA